MVLGLLSGSALLFVSRPVLAGECTGACVRARQVCSNAATHARRACKRGVHRRGLPPERR